MKSKKWNMFEYILRLELHLQIMDVFLHKFYFQMFHILSLHMLECLVRFESSCGGILLFAPIELYFHIVINS